ncbi:MAG: 8-amino-7-oxononanoate synthase [Vicinamibacteria bacterium]|jgi:8-amino-7-oxononanoate synthase|nr:8-amino-7-oxononanoate synthase [Vicinamibacteria bacterium]
MTTRERLSAAIEADLARLRESGLYRALRLPQGIDLVSNDYLGLSKEPVLIERVKARLDEVGLGAGGSRLLRGHEAIFDEAESRLAAYCGAESALIFGSGYAANLGLLTSLIAPNDLVLSDERNHASLIDGVRSSGARKVVYPHQDLDAIERTLKAPRPACTYIVTESVFSMDGDLTPLAEIAALAERYDAALIVDEAHATGLYGPQGAGRVAALGLTSAVLATIHTGGKALGSAGAWIAGPKVLRELLINRARTFVFSTAPMPILPVALCVAIDWIAEHQDRPREVHRKAELLRAALRRAGADTGLSASAIVPIIVGENEPTCELQSALAAAGFDARAVRPPTVPKGTARLRVTARYPVSDEDLLHFAEEVGRFFAERNR